ncbi:hypothetical protein TNCV_3938801 [Trichonephila clavipes]|nr:hypothetical protein TNCV_3938801 [Trichonephila clavipes]
MTSGHSRYYPKYTKFYVSLVIQPIVLSYMNSIQEGKDNACTHTAVVSQRTIQCHQICLLLSMHGRQLQHHSQPALTVRVLEQRVQQVWIPFYKVTFGTCTT